MWWFEFSFPYEQWHWVSFMCLFALYTSWVKCLFKVSVHFLKLLCFLSLLCFWGGGCFFYYWTVKVLYIWWIQVLYQMYRFAVTFVLSAAWLFTLHGLFQRARGLNFDEVLFINLSLCGLCLLELCLRRLCLTQGHRGFLYFFQKFSTLQFHI